MNAAQSGGHTGGGSMGKKGSQMEANCAFKYFSNNNSTRDQQELSAPGPVLGLGLARLE
ncbi:GH24507 [Drosophila grimshawi]|uniref:GH24507 n=1 Tax=Drosophila grimshawi TaxID=7222 RepID=B4JLS1_DROGR|nr:GH24507 [Drosophila grimshawi]